jgi:FKBP-type peptidyl-prolyl cis-trans isomerase
MIRYLPLAALALAACSAPDSPSSAPPPAAAAQPAAPQTDEQKTVYALGVAISSNLAQFALSADEVDLLADGLRDGVLGNTLKVDMATYGPRLQLLAQQRAGVAQERAAAAAGAEKSASDAWVAEQASQPGAQRSPTGVVIIPITDGTGASPTATSTVRVHYHGTLRDGTVFDSSVERNEPISFPLDGVIPCWTEGVQKIKVGGKAKLLCPSDTAYGDQGSGSIPGGAALAFEVELLAIE